MYRAYDANLGRWLSEDPLGEAGGVNLYGYVGNTPIGAVDPEGTYSIDADGTVHHDWGEFFGDVASAGLRGMGAWADGVIPFFDPFADNGVYDPCAPEFAFGQNIGALNRDAAIFIGAGGLGSAILKSSGTAAPGVIESLAVGRGAISAMTTAGAAELLGAAEGAALTNAAGAYGLYDTYTNIRDAINNASNVISGSGPGMGCE